MPTRKIVVTQAPAGSSPTEARERPATSIVDALRVGAPYLVDRDGTIYKTFDDTAWRKASSASSRAASSTAPSRQKK